MKKLITLAALLILAQSARATIYYVDYANGSDSYDGKEQTHTTGSTGPWKHAPGMQGLTPSGSSTGDGCSSNCSSYSWTAGDQIILRGGTTWPYTVAPWAISGSGSGSTSTYGCQGSGCIYVGNAVGAGLSPWNTGSVTAIWLKRDLGGWNPSSPPTVSCSGGGGSGAAATAYVVPAAQTDASIPGFIYNIALTSGGSGYTSAPTCTVSGGGGTATLGADINRAIIDWGATQSSPPDWPLGICSSNPSTCVPGVYVTGKYVIVNGLETRNMLTQNETGGGTNDEEQGVFFEVDGQNVTISGNFAHGAFSDCAYNGSSSGSCTSGDVNHHAIDLGSPFDEAASNVVENGDAGLLGTSTTQSAGYCDSGNFCQVFGFGIGTGTQSGNGPVTIHNNIIYMNCWQLRLVGNDASGSQPYLSYGNELWLNVYDYNENAHQNSRYMQLSSPATLYSYNNIVHNNVAGTSSQIQCPSGVTYYYYNEVQWMVGGGTQPYSLDMADVGGSGGCALNLYNDTMYNSLTAQCVNSQSGSNTTTIVMQNLHCISDGSVANPFWSTGVSGSTYEDYAGSTTQSNIQAASVVDSITTANSGGYNEANLFAPTSASGDTVGFASGSGTANLSSLCSGNLTALCSDINGNARPTTGGWQASAYQFSAGNPPPAPAAWFLARRRQ